MREAGWDVTTMQEHYGKQRAQRVPDVDWITELAAAGFALLASDHRILVNPVERAAIERAEARVFVLPTGALTAAEMVSRFTRHKRNIERKSELSGAGGYVVYENYVSHVYP